jgi:hypothetical protein
MPKREKTKKYLSFQYVTHETQKKGVLFFFRITRGKPAIKTIRNIKKQYRLHLETKQNIGI